MLSPRAFGALLSISALAASSSAYSANAMSTTDVIAIDGESAPGGNGVYDRFTDPPSINDAGQVVFRALLSGTSGGATDDFGVFAADGSIAEVVREGGPLPDGNGTFSSIPFDPAQNASGQVTFRARLAGTSAGAGDDDSVYRWDGATPVRIGREGDLSPDGGSYLSFTISSINASGEVGWVSALTVGGGAVFRGNGVATTEIARSGDPAPGGGGNLFSLSAPALNDSGQVAFASTVLNAPVGQGGSGIFLGSGAALTKLARENDLTGNGTFGQFSIGRPGFNELGQIAFWASLNATSGGSSDDRALFRTDGTTLVEIMREGDPAPSGDGEFTSFSTFSPVINNSGQVAFLPGFTNTPEGFAGVALFDGTAVQELVRTGDPIPLGAGEFMSFFDVSLNDMGQVAFRSGLRETSGGSADDSGIFLSDPSMGLIPVVREGDLLLGSPITLLELADGNDESSGLSNQSEVAFRFELADGTEGVAVWTLPEPALSLALVSGVVGLAAAPRGRRKKRGDSFSI